jgi:hypothetical protein
MKFANDYDIATWQARAVGICGNLQSAVEILAGIAEDANSGSDGWAYWPKPCRASQRLIELIEAHIRPPRPVHAADLRKALSPVRAFYTRQHAKTPDWPAVPPHCEAIC